jgi:archaellum biogenesis protein FlaJ (TadC family)
MTRTDFLVLITNVSYHLFGRWIPDIPSFREDYYKSGIKCGHESYLALSFFSAIISSSMSFTVGLGVEFLFEISLGKAIMGAILLAFITLLITIISFLSFPIIQSKRIKSIIDSNLVYTVGYMSVLSAGGLSIERIFDRVSEVEQRPPIKQLALRFATNVKMFGADVTTSIEDIKIHSASNILSRMLTGIINASQTSGDLKDLLAFETKQLLALKHEQLKKTLANMVSLAELYVSAMVMAPVTFIIMIVLLSVLGNAQSTMSPITQLNLIVFFGIPAICIVFIVILDGVLPKDD